MVAVCKLKNAQNQLAAAKDFQAGFGKNFAPSKTTKATMPLFVVVCADKGLCGAINSSVVRSVRDSIWDKDAVASGKILAIGDKAKSGLERNFKKMFITSCAEIGGQLQPTFRNAAVLADYVQAIEYDVAYLTFQKFRSMIAYDTTTELLANNPSPEAFADYEMEGDTDILQNFGEFKTAVKLYQCLAENKASELSAKMQAMENASKNAGDMIGKLELLMNRTRQAKITTELTEIISGASAVSG